MLHHSPGIAEIYDKVMQSEKNHILDLGQVSASFFRLFSSLKCKIYCESLHDIVLRSLSEDQFELADHLESHLKIIKPREQFNIILSWDLFNYIPLTAIKVLLDSISQHCKPDTLLHCIRYLGARIPSKPAQFSLINQNQLEIQASYLSDRKIRRYSSYEFSSVNPHFYFHFSQFNEAGKSGAIGEDILRYSPNKQAGENHLLGKYATHPHTSTLSESPIGYFLQNFKEYPQHKSPILHAIFTQLRLFFAELQRIPTAQITDITCNIHPAERQAS